MHGVELNGMEWNGTEKNGMPARTLTALTLDWCNFTVEKKREGEAMHQLLSIISRKRRRASRQNLGVGERGKTMTPPREKTHSRAAGEYDNVSHLSACPDGSIQSNLCKRPSS